MFANSGGFSIRKAGVWWGSGALALLILLALGWITLLEREPSRLRGRAAAPSNRAVAQRPPPGKLERTIAGLGYRIDPEGVGSPDADCWRAWEGSEFGLLSKREWFAKGLRPIPGSTDTFHRFHVWEEAFSSPEKAQARLDRFREVPVCAPIMQREYWIASAFRCGSTAYILHTDAVSFEEAMQRVAGRLREEICDGESAPVVRD